MKMIDEKKLIRELEDMIGMLPTCYLGKQNEHDAYWDGFFRALSAVKRQPRAGEWIPVEEGLPESSLNSVIGWDAYRERCVLVQYYMNDWILGNHESVKIIAWMPLPEPYVKGEDER